MKEIELLFELKESLSSTLDKLNSNQDLKKMGEKYTEDYYFYDPLREDLKPDESYSLKKCFRIRKQNDKTYLTYKIDHLSEKGIWQYSDEFETEVNSFETSKKIVDLLGLKPLIQVKNRKHIFVKDSFEITIEDVEGLGLFLEIECLNAQDNADVSTERKKIFEVLDSLKLRVSDELHIGKPELLLRKNTDRFI
ncbi:class IV adenylate cyclase [Candidatus Woesearchaeota archaeon CG10_big_fil_rev_8_21_14_0_10_32_9]|nr:MAG: class IV adenylate cyclase [Candidatus Woesearchaeota archaeon CG10_big_fil_rev_8_21_14_0_10_32_9]